MGLGLGLGIQFNSLGGMVSKILTWGKSIPARFWGTTTPEYWGGLDAQAEAHYNRVIADGGVVPAGLGGVNSFFQVVKGVYGTSDINTAISAAYDPHYLGYRLGAGSGTTLGQAARTLYAPKGIFGGIGTGSAYWEGVGVAGNYVSTPNAAANQITGDIEVIANLIPDSVTTLMTYASKFGNSSGANSWLLQFRTDGTLRINLTIGGTTFNYNSTTTHGIAAGSNVWIKVNRVQSSGAINFYKSSDGTTYTQIGTTVSGSTSAIDNATYNVNIGAFENGVTQPFLGKILRVTIANSIGGTPVVDFNANQYTGANTWTSTTGEVWTVNSTGAGLADVTQTTATSQPLLLAHTGENYWFGSGVSGNYCSTPNSAAQNITSDIELGAYCNFLQVSASRAIIGKSNYSYLLTMETSGKPTLYLNGGGIIVASSIASPISEGWIKVTRNGVTGDVKFYYSSDSKTTSLSSVTWTQLGTTISAATTAITAGTQQIEIGSIVSGTAYNANGKIFRAYLSNSIGGTPVVDFNPSSYNPATSQTQWSSATGEVWSINVGTAATGYKGVLVDRSIVQGDGIDDTLIRSTLPSIQYFSQYVALNPLTIIPSGGEYYVDGGGARGLIYGNVGQVRAWNGSEIQFTGANDNRLNLYNANYNGVSSTAYKNNALNSSGNTGTNISNMISLFSNGSGGSFSNSIINTIVKSLTVDNTTVNTAMYNALRGFDNNAY